MTIPTDTPAADWADEAAAEIVENIAFGKCWCSICEAFENECGCAENVLDRHVPEVAEHIATALRAAEQRGAERERTLILKAQAKRLVPKYVALAQITAELCDEVLDPSGNLLGYVREYAKPTTAAEQETK